MEHNDIDFRKAVRLMEEARDRQDAARQNVQARTDRSAAEGG